MNGILSILLDVFRQPAVIVAMISLIGLAVQGKSISNIVQGSIRTMVGFLVLAAGSGVVTQALDPFGSMFQYAFHVQGVVPNNEAIIGTVLLKYGSESALIFFFGMIVNIILSLTSRFKFIYLTGHVAFYMASMIAVIFNVAGFNTLAVIIFGSLAQGLFITISPALVQSFMRKASGEDDVALGHPASSGVLIGTLVAKLTRSKKHPSKSTEDIKFPSALGFLKDTTVLIALSMAIIYIVVALFAGPEFIESKLSGGQNFIVFVILKAAMFSAGVFVILAGVQVVLDEIVPAFKGISEKLVKNAKPALDAPMTFGFAPNAVLIGFLASFAGGIVGMVIMALAGTTVVIPGIVAHFMAGGVTGVFSNGQAGRRGCIIGGFVNGLVITFLPLLLLPVLGNIGSANSTYSDADYGVAGVILGYSNVAGGRILLIVAIAILYVLFYASSIILTRLENKKVKSLATNNSASSASDYILD